MRKKGKPNTVYNELKARMTFSVTPTAVDGVDAIVNSLGITRSEFLEQIGRGLLQVSVPTQ